jgi:hypothetical protein
LSEKGGEIMENNCEIKIIEIKCNCEDEKLAELVQSVVHNHVGVKPKRNSIVIPGTDIRI